MFRVVYWLSLSSDLNMCMVLCALLLFVTVVPLTASFDAWILLWLT